MSVFFDFITKYDDIFVEKMKKSFGNAKVSHIGLQKRHISDSNVRNFNET